MTAYFIALWVCYLLLAYETLITNVQSSLATVTANYYEYFIVYSKTIYSYVQLISSISCLWPSLELT